MPLKPATVEAYQLLHEGQIAMSRMEEAGIRIDTALLDRSIEETKKKIADLEGQLETAKEHKLWAKHFGNSMNLNSRVQLGKLIFDILGHKRNPFLGDTNDVAAFEHLKLPFVRNYQNVVQLRKALATNLYGLKREVMDGFLHPFFHVYTTESYRRSSSRPNLQNQPTRNKRIAEIVRSCIIPREGHALLEADYSTQEVKISYCYNKDPNLRDDVLAGDMHTDRTKELYILTDEELGDVSQGMGKMVRYCGKNMFVFQQFYGGVYFQAAPTLWNAIAIHGLQRSDGTSLHEHLKSKGIKRLGACDPEEDSKPGTFEHHVKEVQRIMWEERYPVYDKWKRDWWELYQRQGGVNTLTGFQMYGIFRRNQILCDPIQGSASHCLLWANIKLQKEMRKKKMRSKVICEIHDSLLIDAHKREIEDLVEMIQRIAVKEVARYWKWITIPLGVDFEIGEENWFLKKPYLVKEVV